MSACQPFRFVAALLLLSAGNSAFADTGKELPGGDSPAFRDRMMNWSAPAGEQIEIPEVAVEAKLPRVTSRFGMRRDPFTGAPRYHSGIDLAAPLGTPIRSAASGRVSFAGQVDGYGNMVELDHGNEFRTRYAHLSRILVKPGSAVAEGQVIGEAGSTGRSTGNHLHFEVRQNGSARNPVPYLSGRRAVIRNGEQVGMQRPHLSAFARFRDDRGASGGGM